MLSSTGDLPLFVAYIKCLSVFAQKDSPLHSPSQHVDMQQSLTRRELGQLSSASSPATGAGSVVSPLNSMSLPTSAVQQQQQGHSGSPTPSPIGAATPNSMMSSLYISSPNNSRSRFQSHGDDATGAIPATVVKMLSQVGGALAVGVLSWDPIQSIWTVNRRVVVEMWMVLLA